MNSLDNQSSLKLSTTADHTTSPVKDQQTDHLSKIASCAIEKFKSAIFGERLLSEPSMSAMKECQAIQTQSELPKLNIIDNIKTPDTPALEAAVENSKRELTKLIGKNGMADCLSHLSGIPQEKREKFLQTVGAILTDSTTTPDMATRQLLARGIVDQVTHPEKIKQGRHGTCGLASVEANLALSRPDSYAASVYKWTKTIDYGPRTSTNDLERVLHDPAKIVVRQKPGAHRSLVSEIFQTGAANLALAPANQRYEGFSPAEAPEIKTPTGSFRPENDTGERVLDSTGKILTWQGVTPEDETRILKQLTGDNFTQDKLQASSPQQLIQKLAAQLTKDHTPDSISLNFVLGGHAVTIVSVDAGKKQDVMFLDSAEEEKKVLKMSAQQLFDAAIEGDQIVRMGDAGAIDGLTYRKPYKMSNTGNHYLSIVHKNASAP